MITEEGNREDAKGEANGLPEGWVWTTIGRVTQSIEKIDPREAPEQEFTYLDISSIDNNLNKVVEPKTYVGSDTPSRARQRVHSGDVLFSTVRTYLKNIAMVPEAYDGQVASTGFSVLRASQGVDPRFLYYYTLTEEFLSPLNDLQRGTSYPAVRDRDVRERPFPLAPLEEQRRVVAKLEELLTRLDAGVAGLKRVQAALKRYRAAVLKAACEGRLVPQDPNDEPAAKLLERILAERRARWAADLRAKGKDPAKAKYEEPRGPETEALPVLPEGWCWATLQQFAWDSGYGTSQKCDYGGSGPPVLRIPNIVSGIVDLRDLKFAIDEMKLPKSTALAPNDLLIIRTNGSRDLIGRSAVIKETFARSYFYASYLIRYRILGNQPTTQWISTVWDAALIRVQLENMAATSAGQYNVSVRSLNRLAIPLPPQEEQRRASAEVERRLSIANALQEALAVNSGRAERLRQAVLRRAFEGELLPQR
jgi:type I restriction enzyme, S subunit